MCCVVCEMGWCWLCLLETSRVEFPIHVSSLLVHLPGIGRMTDLVLERGLGAEVWTVDGHRYLDMTCGIGVTNTGHCHPKVRRFKRD